MVSIRAARYSTSESDLREAAWFRYALRATQPADSRNPTINDASAAGTPTP